MMSYEKMVSLLTLRIPTVIKHWSKAEQEAYDEAINVLKEKIETEEKKNNGKNQ